MTKSTVLTTAFPDWLLPNDPMNQIKFVTLLLVGARQAREFTRDCAAKAERNLKLANQAVQAFRDAKPPLQQKLAQAEAASREARKLMLLWKDRDIQAQKFVSELEDDLNIIHMIATRGKINTIREGKRGLQITIVIGGKSYTRHLKKQGSKWVGQQIFSGSPYTDLIVEYDTRFSHEQAAVEAVLEAEPLTRRVA